MVVVAGFNAGSQIIDPKTGKLTGEGFRLIQFLVAGVNGDGNVVTADGEITLTNKTIDGDDNTLQDISTTSLKSRTGADASVVTGTAGANGALAAWNTDGDLVGTGETAADILTVADIGVTVQAYGATLTAVEALSFTQGSLVYFSAADTPVVLPKGTAGQVLTMNVGATAPEWSASSSVSAASQSDQEAASSTTVFVSPGMQQFHPSAAKFWGYVTVSAGTPTLQASYNVTSITDTGVGRLTVTIATDFSSANWSVVQSGSPGTNYPLWGYTFKAAGSIRLEAVTSVTGSDAYTDPSAWDFAGYGDQ